MSQVKQKTFSDLNVAQWSIKFSEPIGAPCWKYLFCLNRKPFRPVRFAAQ